MSCIVTFHSLVVASAVIPPSSFPTSSDAVQVITVVAPVPLTGNNSAVLPISMLFPWAVLVKLPSGELTHFSSVRSTKSNAFTV